MEINKQKEAKLNNNKKDPKNNINIITTSNSSALLRNNDLLNKILVLYNKLVIIAKNLQSCNIIYII